MEVAMASDPIALNGEEPLRPELVQSLSTRSAPVVAIDGASGDINNPHSLWCHPAHPLGSWEGNEARRAERMGRMIYSKAKALENKRRFLGLQPRNAHNKSRLAQEIMEIKKELSMWKERFENAVALGARTSRSTSEKTAKATGEKLPRELRDAVYRYYWESYDPGWLIKELSIEVPCAKYEQLQFGHPYESSAEFLGRFNCPYNSFSDEPTDESSKCNDIYKSYSRLKTHLKRDHCLYRTKRHSWEEALTKTPLLDNIILQPDVVGYTFAQEAAMAAYSVAGRCIVRVPFLSESHKGGSTNTTSLFMRSVGLGNLNTILNKDVLGLNVIALDHIRSVTIVLVTPTTPAQRWPGVEETVMTGSFKRTCKFSSHRTIGLDVKTIEANVSGDVVNCLANFKPIYDILAPCEAHIELKTFRNAESPSHMTGSSRIREEQVDLDKACEKFRGTHWTFKEIMTRSLEDL